MIRTSAVLIVLLLLLLSLIGQTHRDANLDGVPQWFKYSVLKVANGSGGCADAGGCWKVNSGAAVAAEADDTQDVVLFENPSGGVIVGAGGGLTGTRITACTGADTVTFQYAGFTSAPTLYGVGDGADLTGAVTATSLIHFLTSNEGIGFLRTTTASESFSVQINVTGEAKTIQDIAAGCAFDVYLLQAVLP